MAIINFFCDPVGRYLDPYYADLEGENAEDAISRFIVEFNNRPDNNIRVTLTEIVRDGEKLEPLSGYPQFELCFQDKKTKQKCFEYWGLL